MSIYHHFRHICVWRGLLLAFIAATIGVFSLVTQKAFIPGRYRSSMVVSDDAAMAIGLAWLGLAMVLHSKYFWGRVEPLWRLTDLIVIVGLLMMIGGWCYALGGVWLAVFR